LKNKRKTLAYIFAFLILGMVLSSQYQIAKKVQPKVNIQMKIEEMLALREEEKKAAEALKEKYRRELDIRETYLKTDGDEVSETLIEDWKTARLYAGFSTVKGEGIVLQISDAKARFREELNDYVVHDKDLIRILNYLKSKGAQAISINDERILTTSELICTGPNVQINRNRYPSPYEIKAIGPKDLLYAEMMDNSLVRELKALNFGVEVKKVSELQIKGYAGDITRVIRGLEGLVQ
jgi:uncharacterized protein YlxW (UPF0749 family)